MSLKDMNLSNRYLRYSHENLTSASAPFVVQYHVTYVQHRSEYQLDHRMFNEVMNLSRFLHTKLKPIEELPAGPRLF